LYLLQRDPSGVQGSGEFLVGRREHGFNAGGLQKQIANSTNEFSFFLGAAVVSMKPQTK
jgi:hypothetical protein